MSKYHKKQSRENEEKDIDILLQEWRRRKAILILEQAKARIHEIDELLNFLESNGFFDCVN